MALATRHSNGTARHAAGDRASIAAFESAKRFFPDGTSRVTIERSPYPRYIAHGRGAYLEDVDGNRFLDLNNNFTTLIHGHAFAPVNDAIQRQLTSGTCFANPTEIEIELAGLICRRVPNLDQIRFVNTGSEAVMFAIKAARALTGKPKIAKFEGAYHGSYDWAEVSQYTYPDIWGQPEAPASTPFCRGVPQSVLNEVVVLRFNDVDSACERLSALGGQISCLLFDPMPSRAGLIAPTREFVDAVQQVCREQGILIVADEVLNFRQSYQGASPLFGLEPDLFALGKIIGGGLPVGAVGGRKETMSIFDATDHRPPVPQGGTFSANPLSMAAGLACMSSLTAAVFEHLNDLGARTREGLTGVVEKRSSAYCVTGAASLFRIHPSRTPPRDFRETHLAADERAAMKRMVSHFLERGIIVPLGASACLSTVMTIEDVEKVVAAFDDFLATEEAHR